MKAHVSSMGTILALLMVGFATGAAGLSWPLCDSVELAWVTKRPQREAAFPGADLWSTLVMCGVWPRAVGRRTCGTRIGLPVSETWLQPHGATLGTGSAGHVAVDRHQGQIVTIPHQPPPTAVFCFGNVNLLGDAIDACMGNGTVCDPAATSDVLCRMMGACSGLGRGRGLGAEPCC